MPPKNNKPAKLALFPKSTSAPANLPANLPTNRPVSPSPSPGNPPATPSSANPPVSPSRSPRGAPAATTPMRRSVGNYIDTVLSPNSAARYKTLLSIPEDEAGPSSQTTTLQQGKVEIDGRHASFLPSAHVSPLKLKSWPRSGESSSGPLTSSQSETWGARFVSDVDDNGSAINQTRSTSPSVLLNISPRSRFRRRYRVDQVHGTNTNRESNGQVAIGDEHSTAGGSLGYNTNRRVVDNQDRAAEQAHAADSVHDAEQTHDADEAHVADHAQVGGDNEGEACEANKGMALPLRPCQQETPPFPQGPRPPVPQRPQPFPPLHDRILTSQSLATLPGPTHHYRAYRAPQALNPSSSTVDRKGKGVVYLNDPHNNTSTKNTGSSTSAFATQQGAHNNTTAEATTSHAPANEQSTPGPPKKVKLLPFFENSDSSLEESFGSPLSLHEEPRTLDLPIKHAQGGPKKPTIVEHSHPYSKQVASVVEPETMTNSRGSPEPPLRRRRQSLRLSQPLEAPTSQAPRNPRLQSRMQHQAREEVGESSRAAEIRSTQSRAAQAHITEPRIPEPRIPEPRSPEDDGKTSLY
ncbi:hypothetical protein GGR53DRAFT_150024 [Hypoxylon sp. FL1150]|nr:hypothetical protein GGR53DRAFT_150024 [Hypoxylon sp. FL1150]